MHQHADLIRKFYTSFQARYADGMNACYHAAVVSLALGPLGRFLGWTPFVQSAIRKQARCGLELFIQKKAA